MPSASESIAERLRDGGPVRIHGGGTKDWGRPLDAVETLDTQGLRGLTHEAGDFTAVVGAGVPLAEAQRTFAREGQMLALDPPDGGATVGGVIATADSGPLRHRYGAPRDLVIGVTLALSDGSVARAGGRVIKNVAGYDLAKLAAGSFGTLGVITDVCLRLHPRPHRTATAILRHDDPDRLRHAALDLANRPLEAEALDIRWEAGEGAVLIRIAGAAARRRAEELSPEIEGDDDDLWEAQRARQRGNLVVRIAGLATELAKILHLARELDAGAVGRAGVGTTWLRLQRPEDIATVRERLHPHPVVLTDAPRSVRAEIDPWDIPEGRELELMRSVKRRFDPHDACNPGLLV